MKRLLALTSLLLLTSCSSIKSENAIRVFNNYEEEPIEISAQTVEYMIKEKYSFPLLMYTESCSTCVKAKETINKLVKSTHTAIYKIEMFYAVEQYLSIMLPDYFSISDYYPKFYLFNEGNVSYNFKIDDLVNYTSLSRIYKSNTINTKISTLSSINEYQDYKSKHKEYLLYIYSSNQLDEQDVYINYLYTEASKSNKNTLIIDQFSAKTDLISYISEEFNLADDELSILSIIENGQIKTTLNYRNQSGDDINNLIQVFFNLDSVNRSF